jgi:hypothetical protein
MQSSKPTIPPTNPFLMMRKRRAKTARDRPRKIERKPQMP